MVLMNKKSDGFTIVELLMVIVVIGILAAISVVAYNGVAAKARDSQRAQDIKTIAKALEVYYIDNGRYPLSTGSTSINNSWSASADASWANLAAQLKPYIGELPVDPTNNGSGIGSTNYGYGYYSNPNTTAASTNFCSASGDYQFYILTYNREGSGLTRETSGTCVGSGLGNSYQDYYRAVR
ncbi:hypothetical protein B7Y94_04780 [Candidatus Saccharibacteria bacterium 32-49-12]|nr:MAG: hypothetical protein B7Y94_04780 [Candidatus Saccharibacteria bacterium 32-49-12]